jgi:Zn-finger nucleic acid-binding protein
MECTDCSGVLIAPEPFERICGETEQQAAVMAWAVPEGRTSKTANFDAVRYLSCPECGKLMNRVNFARYSGVIMDVCKTHGTFFDRDELHQVIKFIRDGGLDAARGRERERLVQEQQRLRRMTLQANIGQQSVRDRGSPFGSRDDSLGQVLKHLFDLQD